MALAPVVASLRPMAAPKVPRMPKMPTMSPDPFGLNGLAMVSRSVKPKKIRLNKKAMAAIEKDWNALREVGAWGEKKAREWAGV